MINKKPLVSVIITCYNYAEFVGDAIESVLNQTYKNIKLVIIDDGSTDNSLEVINKYKDKAQVVTHANKGIVYTRNEALKLAEGEFVCFLDADDYFNPDYIEKSVAIANKTNADIVYPNWHVFGDNEYSTDFKEFDVQLLIRQEIHCTSESLIRLSAIKGHRFVSEKVAEDWDFFLGLALAGKKFKLAKNNYINYRVRKNTRGNSRPFWDDMYEFCKILVKWQAKYPDKVNPFDLPISVGRNKDNRINVLEESISNYKHTLESVQLAYADIEKSYSYRLGKVATTPLRFVRQLTKKVISRK